jgi:hypothetical protein
MRALLLQRYEVGSHLGVYFGIGERLNLNTEVGSGKG